MLKDSLNIYITKQIAVTGRNCRVASVKTQKQYLDKKRRNATKPGFQRFNQVLM